MYLYFFELMNYFYYIFYYRDFIDKIHTNILYNILHLLCLKVGFFLEIFHQILFVNYKCFIHYFYCIQNRTL